MRARTKPVVPIYYDFLTDEEAGTTSIKADGTNKIVTVKTTEWFETHEVIKDGERSKPAVSAASPAKPRKPRAGKAEMESRRAAEAIAAAAKAAKSNGHQTPDPAQAEEEVDPLVHASHNGREAYDLASASEA